MLRAEPEKPPREKSRTALLREPLPHYRRWLLAWFRARPRLAVFLLLLLPLTFVLYARSPYTNYIFDEQEALLANPYVNGHGFRYWEAFKCDFWGLAPDRSIGSYRPIPNLVWRAVWRFSTHPWFHDLANLLIHALNGALVASIAWHWSKERRLAWLAGIVFVTSAVVTEAVSGVVGLADVLGGLGILLAVAALQTRLWSMVPWVFACTLLALFSKESSIVALAIVPGAALISAPLLHRKQPLTLLRTVLALAATVAALVLYVHLRKSLFPSPISDELAQPLPAQQPWIARIFHEFLRWFQQPHLPRDPINNPLISTPFPERIATALRIYLSGLGQVVFPWTLSGDYSFQAELPAVRAWSFRSVLGALLLIGPALLGVALWIKSLRDESHQEVGHLLEGEPLPIEHHHSTGTLRLIALALIWFPICYFPHSNIPLLLPTIRADRFWYLPVIGCSWLIAAALDRLLRSRLSSGRLHIGWWITLVFLSFQATRARIHALSFNSDLDFWRAATAAVPKSAKARLNYGVMLGARGDSTGRLRETQEAIELAPEWAMARVYYGDALCRLHQADEAWPYYRRGFELAPNEPNLIALGLQCLWDNHALKPHEADLSTLAAGFNGSWLAYFSHEIIERGTENDGIEKKYRPRGYDESAHP